MRGRLLVIAHNGSHAEHRNYRGRIKPISFVIGMDERIGQLGSEINQSTLAFRTNDPPYDACPFLKLSFSKASSNESSRESQIGNSSSIHSNKFRKQFNKRFVAIGWKNCSMATVRRLLIGMPDGKRDIRGWRENGEQLDGGIVTRTRIPAGRRNGTGNRQALSQWGPVNTTNRFSMLSNPPRLYRSKSYCRCFHSDHLGQGLLLSCVHPCVRARKTLFSKRYER